MARRYVYALTGAVLSAGAPLGLLVLRRVQPAMASGWLSHVTSELAADPISYAYIAISTMIAFALFGFLIGYRADSLAELSETDGLTALRNARGFSNRLQAELARIARCHEPLALLVVDLDGLKAINDRFGHRAGDVALRHVADAIRIQLRATDTGARWGGDEFAILAPNTSASAAVALAERVRALIARQDVPWRLTASIGVATMDGKRGHERLDAAALMHVADAALYEAKRRGRNTVVAQQSHELPSPSLTLSDERPFDSTREHQSREAS
jgi:diguanylate cyclase (GGDEF)-like protein